MAGEASGDLHGANLINAIRSQDSEAQFRAWGGDRMQQAGVELVKHYRDLAFMGFIQVLFNLRTILNNLKFCKRDIADYQPDALILIDYPGFNMRLAGWAKERGMRVIYYIAPQVWAWKRKRVFTLQKTVDQMLTILPFEKEFFARYGMDVDFVGHPLLDALARRPSFDRDARRRELGVKPGARVVALLPGSRKQEIKAMLPLMLEAMEGQEVQPIIAAAPSQDDGFYERFTGDSDVLVIDGRTYDILEIADAALVTSGTATLETALFGVPQVVCYRSDRISVWIARRLIRVPYISLVNLVLDRPVLRELIQEDCSVAELQRGLEECLSANEALRFQREYAHLRKKLGGEGASQNAAKLIVQGLHDQ